MQSNAGRKRILQVETLDIVSFLIFLSMSAFVIAIFESVYWLYLVVVLIDAAATLFQLHWVISLDRSFFALAVIVSSALQPGFDAFYLTGEVLVLVVVLDFSFLLRKISDTKFDTLILKRWSISYAKTVLLAFFLSFVLDFAYSSIVRPASVGAPLLAISFVGAIFIILIASRSLWATRLFLGGRNRKQGDY